MRMVAGWTLIALALVILFVELFSFIGPTSAVLPGEAPAFGGEPWYEHVLWMAASAALLGVGAWLARDWRRRDRGAA